MSSNLQCSQVERTWKLLCIRFYILCNASSSLYIPAKRKILPNIIIIVRCIHTFKEALVLMKAYVSLSLNLFSLSRCVYMQNAEIMSCLSETWADFYSAFKHFNGMKNIDLKDEIQRDLRSELENFMSHPIDAEMRKVTFKAV